MIVMVYLDNAATSWPKPKKVYDDILTCMKTYAANPGRSGHKMSLLASEMIYECREKLSELFAIENPLTISFTANATEALNIGIKGILKPNDHVIFSSMEHNSVVRPIKKLEERGVSYSIIKANTEGEINIKTLENAITENTKLIVFIHGSNVTGTIMPVKEIGELAKAKNILFMVDAAQTAGCENINVNEMNIDILAFPGHKGLLGPQGTGGIYIKEDIKLDTIKEGGTGSNSEISYQPEIIPDRYESGTLNTPGIAGLKAGVEFILKNGVYEIKRKENDLIEYFLEGLSVIKGVKVYGKQSKEDRIGVISINIKDIDCMEVARQLDKHFNIMVRSGLHCSYLAHNTIGTIKTGTVRFSLNCLNTIKDLDKALKAINFIAKEI